MLYLHPLYIHPVKFPLYKFPAVGEGHMLGLFCFLFYFGRTYFHLLSTGIIDRCVLPCLLYAGLGIEHRTVCMLDTHSTK